MTSGTTIVAPSLTSLKAISSPQSQRRQAQPTLRARLLAAKANRLPLTILKRICFAASAGPNGRNLEVRNWSSARLAIELARLRPLGHADWEQVRNLHRGACRRGAQQLP